MRRLLDYINNNVLFKVASLNSVSVLVRIFAGFFTSKAIAIYIGPEGMALIGNLRNFFGSVQNVATLGIYSGVVKYIAELKNNTKELGKLISTAYYLGFIATTAVCFVIYFNAEYINALVFLSYDFSYVFKILALALPFYSLNLFAFSILNGFSKYRMLLIINIIGQVLGLLITLILIWQNKLDGALISVVISPALMFLITFVGISNQRSLVNLIEFTNIKYEYIKKLSAFSIMALISAIAFPIVFIKIRNYIGANVGLQEAGFWEAMNRISSYYLMFFNTLMTLYILPRFSEINSVKEFRNEVFSFYKTIVPVFAIGLVLVYFLRTFIISIVFTPEFGPMQELFFWQLLGDMVKVLSVVIAYQFVAKRMFWHFIITEIFSVVITYFTSIYFIDLYGVKGATIAHFASYSMYYGIILMIFGTKLFGTLPEEESENLKEEDDLE